MRLAVLSDIHGNLPALEAVLGDIEEARVDRVVVAGDVVIGAPDSLACWHLVAERGLATVGGNHERYLLAAAAGDPAFAPLNWLPARWAADRFDPAELHAIAALPTALVLEDAPGLLVTHSAPHDDYAYVTPDIPEAELLALYGDAPTGRGAVATVVRAHYHRHFERRTDGLHLISIGSVGLPLAGSVDAEYALLEPDGGGGWTAEHRRVPYDLTRTLHAFETSGYLAEAGPMARLFREEVATGRPQLIPFFTRYEAWRGEGVGLGEGVERYLGEIGG